MDALTAARQEIDRIDAELAALFSARMRAVEQIAACKRAAGSPVADPAREREVLARAAARIENPALRPAYTALTEHLLAVSRQYQRGLLQGQSAALQVNLPSGVCPILLGAGHLERAGTLLDLNRRVCIVTDDGVPAAFAEALAAQCAAPVLFRLPAGEGSKSLANFERLLDLLQRSGLTRQDCVLALGGGMVCDLAGFAAACYLRGVDFYSVPTTLLAMTDAAVGGKTAVDLGGFKNLAGVIRQPTAVLIDPALLRTLPARQLANGMAEIVKMALIADAALFEQLARPGEADRTEIIRRALQIKISFVERDEWDAGLRRALNFGHTLGHGIESAMGGALLHGECVALGMLPMCSPAVRARLEPLLRSLGLPTAVRVNPEAVMDAVAHDKKTEAGGVETVFVETVGSFRFEKISLAQLRDRLRTIPEEALQ